MSNDHRDWTNGRFMHAPPVKAKPPSDKQIIDALVAALEGILEDADFIESNTPHLGDGYFISARAALELARKGR